MENLIETLTESLADDPELIIPIVIFVLGAPIAVIAIVFSTVAGTIRYRTREHTRREIAAYIAEGSITADEGERLLKAESSKSKCGSC